MRTLVIAQTNPWPAVDGYRQRIDHLLRSLTDTGAVDFFCLHRPGQPEPDRCPVPGIDRVVVHRAGPDIPTRRKAVRWLGSRMPRRVFAADWSGAREELLHWEPVPDLVWFCLVDTWHATHDLFAGVPAICDFPDLENLALRLRRRTPPRVQPGAGPAERVRTLTRWAASRTVDVVDERRWDRAQHVCADSVDRVVLCSELDRGRGGLPDAAVVPNGADPPVAPRTDRRDLGGGEPTMTFVGLLAYEPNAEAVEWMVREVLPLVRAGCPGARLRVIGRGSERVRWVAGVAGVELVGEVVDLRPELDRTDVSVVPIRAGGGTRLKVVEAMAHHIPLVSTTVGCEGIDLVDGEHALLADDPQRFADACLRLLGDGGLRQRLADSAAELFEVRYTWDAIGKVVADLAREVAAGTGRGR